MRKGFRLPSPVGEGGPLAVDEVASNNRLCGAKASITFSRKGKHITCPQGKHHGGTAAASRGHSPVHH